MHTLARVIRKLMRRPRPAKPLTPPEPAFGKPRPMTGYLATLTPEQRKFALQPMSDESLGDASKLR